MIYNGFCHSTNKLLIEFLNNTLDISKFVLTNKLDEMYSDRFLLNSKSDLMCRKELSFSPKFDTSALMNTFINECPLAFDRRFQYELHADLMQIYGENDYMSLNVTTPYKFVKNNKQEYNLLLMPYTNCVGGEICFRDANGTSKYMPSVPFVTMYNNVFQFVFSGPDVPIGIETVFSGYRCVLQFFIYKIFPQLNLTMINCLESGKINTTLSVLKQSPIV